MPMKAVSPLLVFLALALTACRPAIESAADDRPLADAPNLLHVRDVLSEPDVTLGELVERAPELELTGRPDPSALLVNTNELDDDRSDRGGVPMRLLTQNVGLLSVNVLWVIPYAETPKLEARREVLLERFLEDDPDVLFLQEVWVPEDYERFRSQAEDAGYFVSTGSRDGYNDGLMMLIRESLVDGASVEEGAFDYDFQDGTEWFPGPGIARGYQWVRFEHADLGELAFFNTHMAPYPDRWHGRLRQARQLGVAVNEIAGPDALVFLGGDLNAGPYYRDDVWLLPNDEEEPDWWKNAMMWPVLMEYADLVDLAVMGRPAADAVADVTLGNTVVNDPEAGVTIPGAEQGWCDATPDVTFTATDCNSLYFEQYAATEYPARLDHLLLRDLDGRVRATSSTVSSTEPQDFGGTTVEPSDHYGVLVDVVIDGS